MADKTAQLVQALKEAYLNPDYAKKVINSPNNILARTTVGLMTDYAYWISRAQGIMGLNFIQTHEVENIFGIEFSNSNLFALAAKTIPLDTLVKCENTHILFPGYPLTLWMLYNLPNNKDLFHIPEWCEKFADQPLKMRWYLLRKEPLITKLPDDEYIPHLEEIVYAALLYKLTRGERLFNYPLSCLSNDERPLLYVDDQKYRLKIYSERRKIQREIRTFSSKSL